MNHSGDTTDVRNATTRHLRETAAARVENTSLRSVAREIGMSPTGLKKFLLGTAPYSPTLHRLRNWYVRYAAVQPGTVTREAAHAALSVLLHDLAPDPRRTTTRDMLHALGRGYDQNGKARPVWFSEMLARAVHE